MRRALLLAALAASGCVGPFRSPERQQVLMAEHHEYLEEMRELEQRKDELAYAESWRAAQLGVRLADPNGLTPSGERADWAERALVHADRASVLDPERVEGHYYRAIALGWVLKLKMIGPVSRIPELESAGLQARELEPGFQCAGPLRFLALLYLNAPPWPMGPELAGEEEEIERLFREALRLAPRCPENLFAFAEFLHKEGRNVEALDLALGAQSSVSDHQELEEFERDVLGRRIKELIAELSAIQRK